MTSTDLLNRVSAYYSDKVRSHGATPKGADWRDERSQNLRFALLLEVLAPKDQTRSVAELGCGYGALLDHMRRSGLNNDYIGSDISVDMIDAANGLHKNTVGARFELGNEPAAADYVVASGIFNVRFDIADNQWQAYVNQTIDLMVAKARIGVAFNCLTSHSDRHKMDPRLFYSSPGEMVTWCIERFGRHVSMRHDYGLYEYTMIIRKAPEDRV